ncbi:hypothetical protein H8D29_03505 [PVC group bacterium]|nr:hypothetical protein [PVC group bacterium]
MNNKDTFMCPECDSKNITSLFTVSLPYNEAESGQVYIDQDPTSEGIIPVSVMDAIFEATGDYKNTADPIACPECGWNGSSEDLKVE